MLSERIRSLRNNRGISQVELAEALHVTKQSVSNWENNNIQPSIEVLVKIARYFSVRADYLLGFDDRDYIEITGLSEKELDHIRLIIEDIRKKKETESPDFESAVRGVNDRATETQLQTAVQKRPSAARKPLTA